MKTLMQSAVIVFTLSVSLTANALASPDKNPKLVNAYGEPAGFGNLPQVVPIETKDTTFTNSRPGLGGLYLMPGTVDRRNFESLGSWRARSAAEARAHVIAGTLEMLDSGPTGPMSPEAMDAAREDVTTQVLDRIKTTDRAMRSLKKQTKTLDANTQTRFQSAAEEVAQRRVALRESLRAVRAAGGDEWTYDRSTVAVNYNAYVQSLRRAESAASGGVNS
jgi:hypothetical protein